MHWPFKDPRTDRPRSASPARRATPRCPGHTEVPWKKSFFSTCSRRVGQVQGMSLVHPSPAFFPGAVTSAPLPWNYIWWHVDHPFSGRRLLLCRDWGKKKLAPAPANERACVRLWKKVFHSLSESHPPNISSLPLKPTPTSTSTTPYIGWIFFELRMHWDDRVR